MNRFGNSCLGMETLERFTSDIGNSIFLIVEINKKASSCSGRSLFV